jgi:mRNA interferase RelE/StbE
MWKVEYKKRFLKELSKLPEGVQAQVERFVFADLICENPFDLGFLEQMRGFPGKYKVRFGHYRIGYNF